MSKRVFTQADIEWAYHYGARAAYRKAQRIHVMKMKHGPTAVDEALKRAGDYEDGLLDKIMERM